MNYSLIFLGRRNGSRKNDPNYRRSRSFGMREEYLGSPSHRRSHLRHTQLGNGAQEMVSRLQDSHLLWPAQRTSRKEKGWGIFYAKSSFNAVLLPNIFCLAILSE